MLFISSALYNVIKRLYIGQVNSKSSKPIQLQLNRKRILGSVRQVHDHGVGFGRNEMGKLSKKDS